MEPKVRFIYGGKQYTGYIVSSLIKEPYFHWLFFDEPGLPGFTGEDAIGFQQLNGELVCTDLAAVCHHPDLVEVARAVIREHLVMERPGS